MYKIQKTSRYAYARVYWCDHAITYINMHEKLHSQLIRIMIYSIMTHNAINSAHFGSVMCEQNPDYIHVRVHSHILGWRSAHTCYRAWKCEFSANSLNIDAFMAHNAFNSAHFCSVMYVSTKSRIHPITRTLAYICVTIRSHILICMNKCILS